MQHDSSFVAGWLFCKLLNINGVYKKHICCTCCCLKCVSCAGVFSLYNPLFSLFLGHGWTIRKWLMFLDGIFSFLALCIFKYSFFWVSLYIILNVT